MEEETVATVVKQDNVDGESFVETCSDVNSSVNKAELKSENEKLQCELKRARTALNRSNNMFSRVLSASDLLKEKLEETEQK